MRFSALALSLLVAIPASAQVTTRPPGDIPAPREMTCATFGPWPVPCTIPPSIGYNRTAPFVEWSTQFGEGFFGTQIDFNSRPAGLTIPLGGGSLTFLNATAPIGATQDSYLYGNVTRVAESGSGTTTTGSSSVIAGDFAAYVWTPTIETFAYGILGHAAAPTAGQKIGQMAGGVFSLQMTGTTVVDDKAAGIWVGGVPGLAVAGTDITKVYKVYASETSYGRNFFGQPNDSGLYAAEVVGGKGLYTPDGIQGSKFKTLTDAAAAVAVTICAVPTSDSLGGELIWSTESTDATDFRVTQGRIRFAGVNKAGTTTCTINVVGTDLTASSNANTLVCTWTNVAATTNCQLRATCTDNTTGTQTMAVNYRIDMPIPQTCTPQ